jgi:hypothetical protein
MNNYGLHSLRSEGESAAYKGGVLDRLFKVHGRWKAGNAKDGYVWFKRTLSIYVPIAVILYIQRKPGICVMYLYLLINKTQTQLKIDWRSDYFDVQRKQIITIVRSNFLLY